MQLSFSFRLTCSHLLEDILLVLFFFSCLNICLLYYIYDASVGKLQSTNVCKKLCNFLHPGNIVFEPVFHWTALFLLNTVWIWQYFNIFHNIVMFRMWIIVSNRFVQLVQKQKLLLFFFLVLVVFCCVVWFKSKCTCFSYTHFCQLLKVLEINFEYLCNI